MAATMTLAEVRELVRDCLDEPDENRFPDPVVTRWINRGLAEIFARAMPSQSTAYWTAASVAGKADYPLQADMIRIANVTYEGRELDFRPRDQVADLFGEPLTQQSTPRCYWVWQRTLYLYPIPATSGKSIYVDYYQGADKVSDAGDVLQLEDAWIMCVVNFAAYQLLLIDGEVEAGLARKAAYEDLLEELAGDSMQATQDSAPIQRVVDAL